MFSCHTPVEAREEADSATKVTAQSTITRSVNGFVRDDSSGEPIPYANVFLAGTSRGSTTNEDGYFVLSKIAPGSYKLNVTMMGYRAVLRELTLSDAQNSRVDIRLIEDILQTEGVTVEASYSELKKSVQSSQIKLDIKDYSRALMEKDGVWAGFRCKIGSEDSSAEWAATMQALDEVGYRGWGSAEVSGGERERLADIARRMDDVASR